MKLELMQTRQTWDASIILLYGKHLKISLGRGTYIKNMRVKNETLFSHQKSVKLQICYSSCSVCFNFALILQHLYIMLRYDCAICLCNNKLLLNMMAACLSAAVI